MSIEARTRLVRIESMTQIEDVLTNAIRTRRATPGFCAVLSLLEFGDRKVKSKTIGSIAQRRACTNVKKLCARSVFVLKREMVEKNQSFSSKETTER